MINEEAIRQAVKNIEASPENWDQRAWTGRKDPETGAFADTESALLGYKFKAADNDGYVVVRKVEKCQTTFCLAGQIMLNAGLVNAEGRYVDRDGNVYDSYYDIDFEKREHVSIFDAAAELAGLSKVQAEHIFFYGTGNDRLGPESRNNATVAGLKERIALVTGITFED